MAKIVNCEVHLSDQQLMQAVWRVLWHRGFLVPMEELRLVDRAALEEVYVRIYEKKEGGPLTGLFDKIIAGENGGITHYDGGNGGGEVMRQLRGAKLVGWASAAWDKRREIADGGGAQLSLFKVDDPMF